MRERGLIALGLAVLVLLAALPFGLRLVAGNSGRRPALVQPRPGTACVADKEYMSRRHMELLSRWRDMAVREGRRTAVENGREHEINLQRACLECHGGREGFCDRCHDYSGVSPKCWDCHFDPAREGRP